MSDARYEPVRQALPETLPPITREEAERAARRLYVHFGKRDDGARFRRLRAKHPAKVRRCWISTKPTVGHFKGWGRLVHDVSHRLFQFHYPNKRPHDPLHARWELDVAAYVVAAGWLEGGLKPKVKPKPTVDEKRAQELVRTEAAIKRWQTKAKRAATALTKLERKRRRLAA